MAWGLWCAVGAGAVRTQSSIVVAAPPCRPAVSALCSFTGSPFYWLTTRGQACLSCNGALNKAGEHPDIGGDVDTDLGPVCALRAQSHHPV